MTFKKIATVPSVFLTPEETSKLNLKEQPLIILLSKSLVTKSGIHTVNPSFDLILDKGKMSLVTSVPSAQQPDTAPKDDHNE